MKLILIFFVLFNYANSQQIVGIGMGPSYQYDIYYSFDSGITAYPERNNWHLAFSTDLSSGNIRINSGAPVSLYEVGQSFDSWSQIESLNQNAVQLRNSNTDWNIGAFVSNSSDLSNQNFDMPELSEPKTIADELPNLILSILFFELRDVA